MNSKFPTHFLLQRSSCALKSCRRVDAKPLSDASIAKNASRKRVASQDQTVQSECKVDGEAQNSAEERQNTHDIED